MLGFWNESSIRINMGYVCQLALTAIMHKGLGNVIDMGVKIGGVGGKLRWRSLETTVSNSLF